MPSPPVVAVTVKPVSTLTAVTVVPCAAAAPETVPRIVEVVSCAMAGAESPSAPASSAARSSARPVSLLVIGFLSRYAKADCPLFL